LLWHFSRSDKIENCPAQFLAVCWIVRVDFQVHCIRDGFSVSQRPAARPIAPSAEHLRNPDEGTREPNRPRIAGVLVLAKEDRLLKRLGVHHDEGETEHDQEVLFMRPEVVGELQQAKPDGVGAVSQRLIQRANDLNCGRASGRWQAFRCACR
jgi:hypothetical protein